MIHYKHVIWDYNGTLLNDVDLSVSVMNRMLKARNLPLLSLEKYRSVFDFPVATYYAKLGFDFEAEPFDVLGLEFIQRYDNRRSEMELHPFAHEILQHLSDKGISQSVLSARNQKQLEEELEHYSIRKYFTHVSGLTDDYAGGKSENGLKMTEKINFDKSQIVLIGDTMHDFETAEMIGIDCIIVANGHHSKEKFIKTKSQVVTKLCDLMKIF